MGFFSRTDENKVDASRFATDIGTQGDNRMTCPIEAAKSGRRAGTFIES